VYNHSVLFAEGSAQWLLIVHLVLAGALVASATHLVIWMRGFWQGRFIKLRATRRFAVITLSLYLATFLIGNIIYPIYKVRVRAEYFDQPSQVVDDYRSRLEARGVPLQDAQPPDHLPRDTAKIARWFDVKEHWIALGLALSAGLCALLFAWDPKRDGGAPGSIAFMLAVGAAGSVWFGAIVGALVTSYRSIGGVG
jgi:hypothetical protein